MSTIGELQKLSEREDYVEFKKAEYNYPFAGGQKTDSRDRRHCVLGKSEAINRYLPQANVVVEYRNNHSQVRYSARQEYRLPLFVAIERIWEYIDQPACNPLLHVNDLPRILDCPAFRQ